MNFMEKHTVWLGKAICALTPSHKRFNDGYRGAIAVVCSLAPNISCAVEQICTEFLQLDLAVIGFEYIENQAYIEREPSEYEAELIAKLESYPVQFADVHIFKPDA